MAYTDSVVKRARARLAAAQKEREVTAKEHLEEAYNRQPRLREIDLELRRLSAAAVCTAISHGTDPAAAIDALKERSLSLQNERQWLLDDAGYDDDYLDNSPVCEKCGGSGYIGALMCECLRELCRQEQKRELTWLLATGKESFENFSLDFYPDTFDPSLGTSARKMMQHNLAICQKYAVSFHKGAGSFLFSGSTGLGKTFLSGCIAKVVADSGFSVVYETAAKVFADFEAVKFRGAEESLIRKYLDCDLMIIDDLGTEMSTQFSVSALYTLINSRMVSSKAVIISTNLSPDTLGEKYSPQVASRILGSYQLIPFVGEDIRLMK